MGSNRNNGNASGTMSNGSMQTGDASTTIGGMPRAEFDRINAEGARTVMAIEPTSAPLSDADRQLMMQMAMGGMMQLQISQAALPRTTRDDARTLAQGEVEEQTTLSNKLMEIARAKGVSLPAEPAPETRAMMQRMEGLSGAQLDAFYVQNSGVDGHKKLEATMSTVSRTAKDPALKAVADAALPLIRTHMAVSKNIVAGMNGGTGGGKEMKKTKKKPKRF